jgi:futalosine hydrolase
MLVAMADPSSILVVAATARELNEAGPWQALLCGVGPVDAAAITAAGLAAQRPAALLHVGIAGARRERGLPPCTVIIGSEARYCDLLVPADWAPSSIAPPQMLVEAVRRAAPDALLLPIGTTARVGGSAGCDIEAMEGFGVLRAARLAGVPAIEVRVVANEIEEEDRTRWHFDDAFAAIVALTPRLVDAVAEAVAHA